MSTIIKLADIDKEEEVKSHEMSKIAFQITVEVGARTQPFQEIANEIGANVVEQIEKELGGSFITVTEADMTLLDGDGKPLEKHVMREPEFGEPLLEARRRSLWEKSNRER